MPLLFWALGIWDWRSARDDFLLNTTNWPADQSEASVQVTWSVCSQSQPSCCLQSKPNGQPWSGQLWQTKKDWNKDSWQIKQTCKHSYSRMRVKSGLRFAKTFRRWLYLYEFWVIRSGDTSEPDWGINITWQFGWKGLRWGRSRERDTWVVTHLEQDSKFR